MNGRHLSKVLDWREAECGAALGEGDKLPTTNEDAVECKACLKITAERGVGTPTPLHEPPRNRNDGVFTFYDVDYNAAGQLRNRTEMEVVPQTTGNVEFTVGSMGNDGLLFTLSHSDRADMLRALLHDFHYSPERGGPNDD